MSFGLPTNVQLVEDSATGTTGRTVPTTAHLSGAVAATTNPTNAVAGNLVGLMADKAGRLVTTGANVRELIGVQQTTIASGTAETTIVSAGGAGVFNDLTELIITTINAVAATLTLKDATTGTTRAVFDYPNAASAPGVPLVITFNPPLPQAVANNNWTLTASVAAGAIHITAVFAKNS